MLHSESGENNSEYKGHSLDEDDHEDSNSERPSAVTIHSNNKLIMLLMKKYQKEMKKNSSTPVDEFSQIHKFFIVSAEKISN